MKTRLALLLLAACGGQETAKPRAGRRARAASPEYEHEHEHDGSGGIQGAKAIAAGLADACALLEGSLVMCWGEDRTRKDGNSRFDDAPTPVSLRLPR